MIALHPLFLLIFVAPTMALRMTVGNTPFCMSFEVNGKHTLVFMGSGDEEINSVHCTVEQNEKSILDVTQRDYTNTHEFAEGHSELCFNAAVAAQVTLSFDFFPAGDPIRSVIEKKDLREVQQVLVGAHAALMNVARNQQFHIERDQAHKRALQESEESIQIAGVTKIIVLLASAFIQLWIMKSFFGRSEAYQPVQLQ